MGLQREDEDGLLDTGNPDQVRAAGAVPARLQDALALYPDADRLARPAAARDTLRRLIADARGDRLPTQLVHHDFRAANVVCGGAEVAAVIDFEEAGFDHRVVELSRSAVLLGTRFRNWGPVSVEVRADFLAGYQSVRELTPAEAGWWDILVLWHALAIVPPGDDPTGWGASALRHLAELTHEG